MPNAAGSQGDLALLRAAREGDHEAGALLVRRHGASMMHTAWSVTGRYATHEADDVVQEALIAALTTDALPSGDVGAWLRAITARKALDGLRRRMRRVERPIEEVAEMAGPSASRGGANVPLAILGLRQALARLAPIDRAVLTLVDVEGFTMSEAARAIGSTTMAVKWRAVRARRRLRAFLQDGSVSGGEEVEDHG